MRGRGGNVFGRRGRSGFSGVNVLGATWSKGIGVWGTTVSGIVSSFSILEAAIFSDTFGTFGGGEF